MVGERRDAFVHPGVGGDVPPRSQEQAVGDTAGRPQMVDDEVEERAAAGTHPRLLGLHETVGSETSRQGPEAIEERADLVQALRRAVAADGSLEAGRAIQGDFGSAPREGSDLECVLHRPAAGAAAIVAELHQDGKRSRGCREPLRQELHGPPGIHGTDDLQIGIVELRGDPADRRWIGHLVRDITRRTPPRSSLAPARRWRR